MDGRTRTGAGSEPKGIVQKTRTCGVAALNMEAAGFSEMFLVYLSTELRANARNKITIIILTAFLKKKHESGENSFFL